jgi:hypothetical protein
MSFVATPTTWFPNWSEDGTTITVPIATFPELTAVEADGTTGDIRKIIYAMVQASYAKFISLPVADRPTKMVVEKRSTLDAATNILTSVYTFTFKNEILSQDVAPEV